MLAGGESRNTVVRSNGNGAVPVDSQGARITSDLGFLSPRELATSFRTIHPMGFRPDDLGSLTHTRHSPVPMGRPRVYRIALG
jgi:hypothetical protein